MVKMLRKLGHKVITSYEAEQANQGIPDDEVLHYATKNNLILITFDRDDFVELHQSGTKHKGIVICKTDRDYKGQVDRLQEYLQTQLNFENRLIRVKKQNQKGFEKQVFVIQEYSANK